jgi:hypothetical protein
MGVAKVLLHECNHMLIIMTFKTQKDRRRKFYPWHSTVEFAYIYIYIYIYIYTECPTTYKTQQLFNNFTTNEDIAQQLGAHYRHIPLHFSPTNVLLFKSRCNIFIGFGIIKELPCLVVSGTLYIYIEYWILLYFRSRTWKNKTSFTYFTQQFPFCPSVMATTQ